MSVKINKTVSITIDEDDIDVLADVCKCARDVLIRYSGCWIYQVRDETKEHTYRGQSIDKMLMLINKVLGA